MSQSLTQLGALRTGSRSQYGKVTTSSDSVDIRKSRSTRISLVNRVPILQLSKAGVCFTLATAEELSSVSFVTAPVPSEYTEEERRILLVIPQWTSDMLTMLGRVTCYFSLLLKRDDAFRDPDQIRLCLEVEFALQCNDWLTLGFAG